MIQKFGEPIADHYNVDAEQLYMDNQVRCQSAVMC